MERLLASTEREVDEATKQMALSMADALDLDQFNAQLWRTYREVVGDVTAEEDAGDETEDEIEAIRGTATVVNLKAVR